MSKSLPKKSSFHDAFPPDGLVAQYKPFILSETKKYSQRYKLPFRFFIHEAVDIANAVAEKFDPQRGYDFSTPLRWHLRGLNRHAQKLRRKGSTRREEYAKLEDWEKSNRRRDGRRASERGRHAGWSEEAPPADPIWSAIHHGRDSPNRKGGSYAKWKEEHGPKKLSRLAKRSAAEFSSLNDKQRAVLHWMIGDLSGRETRTMMQAASDIGITRGYASKVVSHIASCITFF